MTGAAPRERRTRRGSGVSVGGPLVALLALLVGLAFSAWSQSGPAGAAATRTTTTHGSRSTSHTKPLSAPRTSFAQDTAFFTEVTEADPLLVGYEQKRGNLALQALLTDGSAFCALLERGGGIDRALVAEAEGARSTESQTSLPLSVTTFNSIESVALLTLCPSEQKLVPAAVRSKIRHLGDQLAKRRG